LEQTVQAVSWLVTVKFLFLQWLSGPVAGNGRREESNGMADRRLGANLVVRGTEGQRTQPRTIGMTVGELKVPIRGDRFES
jgi:hypothetical protein